jgi:hypothetical protein
MKLMSKYRNAASSVGQWPAFLNSANFIADSLAIMPPTCARVRQVSVQTDGKG